MGRPNYLLRNVMGLVAALCLIGVTFFAFRAIDSKSTALRQASPSTGGYPPAVATTAVVPDPALTAVVATHQAPATASAPPSSATSGPLIGPQTLIDPEGRYRLKLRSGWRAYLGNSTAITNYDVERLTNVHTFPPGGMKIQIEVGKIRVGQTFEQWLSAWIAIETAPPSDSSKATLAATYPESYKLGSFDAVRFTIAADNPITEIDVPTNDGSVIFFGISPTNSPAMTEALSMLASLEIPTKPLSELDPWH